MRFLYNDFTMDNRRSIAVIDMKAFYAYVECVDRGLDPWKAPLIVADKERGKNTIILSVSPYLKSKGVPSRLRVRDLPPGFDYIYATPRMERYIERSSEVVNIMLEFVSEEDIHVYSIDEAFIDLTSYLSYYKKSAYELTKEIIETIKRKTELQATGGIGDNFFLAKVALDIFAKHEKDGIAMMHIEDVKTKLWPITPLTEIWGIGERTAAKLNRIGIYSVGDLANANRDYFKAKFGIMGEQLIDHANGIDEADIHEEYIPNETSLSIGQTLHEDYTKKGAEYLLKEMNDDLSAKLRGQKQTTALISVTVMYSANQGGFSRQMSLLRPTNDTKELYDAIIELYHKHIGNLPIRGLHISYGKLRDIKDYEQLNIFLSPEVEEKRKALNEMIDLIHNRYGKNVIIRANSLLEGTAIERHSQIGGHRK